MVIGVSPVVDCKYKKLHKLILNKYQGDLLVRLVHLIIKLENFVYKKKFPKKDQLNDAC